MQIKVFKSGNMKDAMTAMKAELGEDAVILHSKKYKEGGILGIGSREVVEITAAVEETSLPKRTDTLRLNHPTVAPNSLLTRYKTDGTEQGVAEAEQRVEKLTQLDALAEKVSAQKAQDSDPPKNFEEILQAETREMQLEIRNEELGMEDDSVSTEEKSESIEETPSSEETIQFWTVLSPLIASLNALWLKPASPVQNRHHLKVSHLPAHIFEKQFPSPQTFFSFLR